MQANFLILSWQTALLQFYLHLSTLVTAENFLWSDCSVGALLFYDMQI